jgi:hypothetical protein
MSGEWSSLCARLVERAAHGKLLHFAPIAGGRNNKVFRAETSKGVVLFKSYFYHPQDTRDRLGQEFSFLEYLQKAGCTFAARPILQDPETHTSLMEFMAGDRPALDQITTWHIEQAITFYLAANQPEKRPFSVSLPMASEACFSLQQHAGMTQRRVDRLSQMQVESDVDREAQAYVKNELLATWQNVRAVLQRATASGVSLERELMVEERVLSPSDFGFHNSLHQVGMGLRFVDFEYAGWDDPAKLIADFANQPDMILPRALSDLFQKAVVAHDPNPERLRLRVRWLEPLYQVKWACICLNDFLQLGRSRHAFTEGEREDHQQRRTFQLSRSRMMLARAQESLQHSII